ncbi:sugar porter family MFS transporter [Echinicola sediminis]
MDNENLNKRYITLVCFTAGLGGFLFGFDTAVASGTIGFLRDQFDLDSVMEGWIMSSALLGSVLGAIISGYLSDKFGRKKMLMVSAILFLLSAFGTMLPDQVYSLVIFRMIGGIGVGIAAMVAPLFISELSPAPLRGRLVSLYQLAITLGILCSYFSNTVLLNFSSSFQTGHEVLRYIFVDEVWRAMFGSEIVPAFLFFLMLFFVPKSPRWLTKEGRIDEAFAVLNKVHGETMARKEMEEINKAIQHESSDFKQLFKKGLRMALIIGLALPIMSQLGGITTVMYYAPTIFDYAGFQSNSAFGNAILIGFFNMIFTIVAIWKIDQFGRKPLLIIGFLGLSLALFIIGFQFQDIDQGMGADDVGNSLIGAFIFYIAVFAATIGPGVWVVIAEIFPTKVRGRAMAVGTTSLFVGSTLVTQTFPALRAWAGIEWTFWLYGLLMIPTAIFVWKFIPETKNKTLEEIEASWNT